MHKRILEFHIRSNDYFGTLATILSLIIQSSNNGQKYKRIMKNIIIDLIYLQKKFIIIRK
jgi:hypothetical protein